MRQSSHFIQVVSKEIVVQGLMITVDRRPTIELKGHPSTEKRSIVISTCMVQSFLPCQLRFACLLFCDEWIAYALAATMCTIVVYRMYLLGTRVGCSPKIPIAVLYTRINRR